jgi:hypothetical protein
MLVIYVVLIGGNVAGAFSDRLFTRIVCPIAALMGIYLIARHLKNRRDHASREGMSRPVAPMTSTADTNTVDCRRIQPDPGGR